jgi:positive regulator of sigma E activity
VNCEKRVEVVAVMADHCWVKPMSQPLCSACEELGRCRSDWLRQKTSGQTFEIPLSDPISLNVGEVVTLCIDGQRLSSQLVKLYILPLLGLVGPIIVGQSLAWSETLQAGAGLFGLALGWVFSQRWIRTFQIRINR